MRVLTEERQHYILEKLEREHIVKLNDLTRQLNCSISTVRRDLSQLEEKGLLIRVHGGAKRNYSIQTEIEMNEKRSKNVQSKQLIGQLAASIINEQEIIYLDAGTTTYEIIPYLKEFKDLKVITNGLAHAQLLTDLHIETIQIGGQVKEKTQAIIGSVAQKQLEQYRFNKAFIGINGIDYEYGYTTPDLEEAAMKKLAGKQANQCFVVADHTKFHHVSFAKVGELDDYSLLTDSVNDKDKRKLGKEIKIWEAKK